MGFDITQSRNGFNERCYWWAKNEDEDEISGNELAYKRVADGSFWAKEASAETSHNNVLSGVFMSDKNTVTIYTPDSLFSMQSRQIESECYVLYQDEFWIVTDVQKKKARMQSSVFASDKKVSHYWYISLRK